MRQVIPGIQGFPLLPAIKLRCTDPHLAERAVGSLVEPRRFHLCGGSRKSDIRISHVPVGFGHLFGVSHGAALVATSAPISSYQIMAPLRGELVGRGRKGETRAQPGSALVYSAGDALDTRWSEDCIGLVLSVPGERLRALARISCPGADAERLRLQPRMTLDRGHGRSFANTLGLIARESLDPTSSFCTGLTTRMLEQTLLLSLLAAQMKPEQQPAEGTPGYMRRALRAIEQAHGEDIGLADLASQAGVSIRTLQYGFRDRFGVGPMAYLRQFRMRRVHDALRDASPENCRVGDVAARWGFSHGSAFARGYREMFGELPSKTLAAKG